MMTTTVTTAFTTMVMARTIAVASMKDEGPTHSSCSH